MWPKLLYFDRPVLPCPDEPGENEYSANCQSLPAGCEQGDCSCFEEKIPHVCHNDGRIIIMIPRQQAP